MNFAYFRKSKYSKEETISKVKEIAANKSLSVLGEISLPKADATLIQICGNEWLDQVLKEDKNLVGLMPCSVLVTVQNGQVNLGSGNPAILGGVSQSKVIQNIATEAEGILRDLINEASGAGEQKIQDLKLYSTMSCPYCTMEKQWLESNDVKHSIVYVDKDQIEAEKMVRNTGQMGVPVTEVIYDDGESEFIVGFNKQQLAKVLNLKG